MNGKSDPLYSIVGDEIRVKLLRVFTLNKDTIYSSKDFTKTLRKQELVIKEVLKWLEKDGIIKKRKFSPAEKKEKDTKELRGYMFNGRYPHQKFLDKIIKESLPTEKELLAKKVARIPGVRCVVTTDMFVEKRDGHADLIVASVEDNEPDLRNMVQEAEQSIGREIQYVFLTVNDLLYRIRINDKFIWNILDGNYNIHLDKVGLPKK